MKLSNTCQRRVIMEELRKLKCHPTADELYCIVKQRLPKISLATVYRNLGLLADAGEITEEERRNLTSGGGAKSNPALMEWLMGFPIGWTDLEL